MYADICHQIVLRLYNVFELSIRTITLMLNISKSTIHRWLTKTKNTIRKTRTSKYDISTITTILEKDPCISLRRFISKYSFPISKSWLHRLLQSHGYRKNKTYPCGTVNMEEIIKKRKIFVKNIQHINEDDVISIDETSFYNVLNPLKAWTTANKRIHVPIQRKVGKRFTLITAISNSRLVHQTIFEGSCNATKFAEFIKDISCKQRYFFLDNVSFHKTKTLMQLYKNIDKESIFISPYSPEWNPVELHFAILKSKLRNNLTFSDIYNDFTCRHYYNIFKHVFENIHNCYHK